MSPKQIDVVCPCCEVRLTIDVLTQTVMKTAKPSEIDETGKAVLDESRWDQARKKISDRGESSADKLEDALDSERKRSRRLDDLFDKANDKIARKRDESDD